MKLIDKEPLVAEIEKLESRFQNGYDEEYADGYHYSLELVKRILDTLEVKEVDLYEDADNYWGTLTSDIRNNIYLNDFYKIAKHFFELGMIVSNKVQKGE